jgi:hypothetical protein
MAFPKMHRNTISLTASRSTRSSPSQWLTGLFAETERPMTAGSEGIVLDDGAINRSASNASTAAYKDTTPSRSGTLKKRASLKRKSSLGRSGSRRSTIAGSIGGAGTPGARDDYNSALATPIPTHGSPTDVLANRFQGVFPLCLVYNMCLMSITSMAHSSKVAHHLLPRSAIQL